MTKLASCVRCRRVLSNAKCPVCSGNRLHMDAAIRVCETNKCGHMVACASGGVGCDLHPVKPGHIRRHLLDGGGCLSDSPMFGKFTGPSTPAKRSSLKRSVPLRSCVSRGIDDLHKVALITTHFNPCGFRRLRETYFEWVDTLGPLADRLECVELVFDSDAAEIPRSTVIRGTREKHLMWQKEALINSAIRRLGPEVEYVAWLDHDFVFTDREWLGKAIAKLDSGLAAVQLFRGIAYLTKDRKVEWMRDGAMHAWRTRQSINGNPGGNWMAKRNVLDTLGGVNAHNIVGGGDQVWFDAMRGVPGGHLSQYSPALRADLERWIRRASSIVGSHSACHLDGTIQHLWHGDRSNRQYQTRNEILIRHEFDPATDVRINESGILEWSSDKPELHAEVQQFFLDRREDG